MLILADYVYRRAKFFSLAKHAGASLNIYVTNVLVSFCSEAGGISFQLFYLAIPITIIDRL